MAEKAPVRQKALIWCLASMSSEIRGQVRISFHSDVNRMEE